MSLIGCKRSAISSTSGLWTVPRTSVRGLRTLRVGFMIADTRSERSCAILARRFSANRLQASEVLRPTLVITFPHFPNFRCFDLQHYSPVQVGIGVWIIGCKTVLSTLGNHFQTLPKKVSSSLTPLRHSALGVFTLAEARSGGISCGRKLA